jgi:hypothetical protein
VCKWEALCFGSKLADHIHELTLGSNGSVKPWIDRKSQYDAHCRHPLHKAGSILRRLHV